MAVPPDRVQLIKQESAALGGDGSEDVPYNTPIEPQEDAIEAAGLFLQDASNRDETTLIWRDTDNDMKFKDGNNPSGATLTDLLDDSDYVLHHIIDEDVIVVTETTRLCRDGEIQTGIEIYIQDGGELLIV